MGRSPSNHCGVTLLPKLSGDTPSTPPTLDAFGSKAAKLGALLGQGAAARVLLVGSLPLAWVEDFQSHFAGAVHVRSSRQLETALESDRQYDLIVYMALLDSPTRLTSHTLSALRRSLTLGGSLFALVENRFGARALMRDPTLLWARGRTSPVGFRRKLGRAGFERIREFLPLPSLSNVEEFVVSNSGAVALPSHATRIEGLLNRAGVLSLTHDSGAFIASGENGGSYSILRDLGDHLTTPGKRVERLELERFDLRDRGALILLVKGTAAGDGFVCRVTTDAVTDRAVRRNRQWIERIADTPGISQEIKAVVPKSLGVFRPGGGTAYTESRIPGSIAWKLAGSKRLEPTLFKGVYAFAAALSRDTVRQMRVDEALLAQLLDPSVPQTVDDSVAAPYEQLRHHLRARMLGEQRLVVLAHGDFGYGNAIADPRTGALCGIIDWDQGREDLAGVDLVNFLIQRERSRRVYALPDAFEETSSRIIRDGFKRFDERIEYEERFPLGPEKRAELFGWAALRFAQRGMTYPSLFVGAREETRAILEWACAILK